MSEFGAFTRAHGTVMVFIVENNGYTSFRTAVTADFGFIWWNSL